MILGRVVGEVWATKKNPRFQDRKILLVAVLGRNGERHDPTGEVVVALDTIGARYGNVVTVTWGSGARAVFQKPDNRWILADAAISRIVDGTTEESGKGEEVECSWEE